MNTTVIVTVAEPSQTICKVCNGSGKDPNTSEPCALCRGSGRSPTADLDGVAAAPGVSSAVFENETDMNTPFTQQSFDIGALYAGNYLKADDLEGKAYPQ